MSIQMMIFINKSIEKPGLSLIKKLRNVARRLKELERGGGYLKVLRLEPSRLLLMILQSRSLRQNQPVLPQPSVNRRTTSKSQAKKKSNSRLFPKNSKP